MMSEGFKFGRISYHRHFFDYDHYYKCSREGNCVCAIEEDSPIGWVVFCDSQVEFEWEEWTVKVYFDLECDPPTNNDPPDDPWEENDWE